MGYFACGRGIFWQTYDGIISPLRPRLTGSNIAAALAKNPKAGYNSFGHNKKAVSNGLLVAFHKTQSNK